MNFMGGAFGQDGRKPGKEGITQVVEVVHQRAADEAACSSHQDQVVRRQAALDGVRRGNRQSVRPFSLRGRVIVNQKTPRGKGGWE